jgi:hypothetical protein
MGYRRLGDGSARDLLGRDFSTNKEAREHGRLLARQVGTDKPGLVGDGNFVSIVNEAGVEVFLIPITSAAV